MNKRANVAELRMAKQEEVINKAVARINELEKTSYRPRVVSETLEQRLESIEVYAHSCYEDMIHFDSQLAPIIKALDLSKSTLAPDNVTQNKKVAPDKHETIRLPGKKRKKRNDTPKKPQLHQNRAPLSLNQAIKPPPDNDSPCFPFYTTGNPGPWTVDHAMTLIKIKRPKLNSP